MENIINEYYDHKTKNDHTSSSDGKMVIKLKIPKKPPENNNHVIEILNSKTSEEAAKKICLECKKEFSSGKALGGHMRIHVTNKNPNFLKPSKINTIGGEQQTKPYYMNSVNHEGKPTCSQCGKTFPSMKSLFGHMRCHPERVWRGILPPPHTPTAVVTTASRHRTSGDNGDEAVDLTRFLRRWPVKERRGRKAVKPAEDDVVLLAAVEDLMRLAKAGASVASVTTEAPEKLEVDDMDVNVNESDSNEQLLINCKLKIKKPKRMKLTMEFEPNDIVTDENSESQPLPELQQTVRDSKYKCTTCNKCFATHQALGGHRSSHNKPKMTSPNRHPSEEYDHKTFVMNIVSSENMERDGVHQCKICDKVFATGQALGGHQRCHWSGTTFAPAQSSQITSTGDGGSQTGDRKVLDFDLNEVPVGMIEEDDGGDGNGDGNGNGNGYVSSSYNSNIC